GALRIEPRHVQAYVNAESLRLTSTEFRVLYTLALQQGHAVSRAELLRKIWDRPEHYRDRTVDVFIRRLRRKLEGSALDEAFINPDVGVGYALVPRQAASRDGR